MASEIGSQRTNEARTNYRKRVHEAVEGKKHSLDELAVVPLAGRSLDDFDSDVSKVKAALTVADELSGRDFEAEKLQRRAAVQEKQKELDALRAEIAKLNTTATGLHKELETKSRLLQQVEVDKQAAIKSARRIKPILDEFDLSTPAVDELVTGYYEERARRTGVPAGQA